MRMNRYPPFRPAVCPLLKTAEQRRAVAKGNRRFFLRPMRSGDGEKQKTGWKQRGSVMLSVPFRRWDVHLAYAVRLNRNEAGKASYARFSGRLVNFGKYFSRVGECENQGGIEGPINDWRCDPPVHPWKRPPRVNFFSRVDSCESQRARRVVHQNIGVASF